MGNRVRHLLDHVRGRSVPRAALLGLALVLTSALTGGCIRPREYVHNGFKVGPNYQRPAAAIAESWIDADDPRVLSRPVDDSRWWDALGDPMLDALVQSAYRQNLSLRERAARVLAARARLGIAIGELFPQQQQGFAQFSRTAISGTVANRQFTPQRFFDIWQTGFNLSWELDFWGRFRRAIEETGAVLNASIEDYDAVLVTTVADVASNYVTMRTLQTRIALAEANVKLQRSTLDIVETQFKGGITTGLDVEQAKSNLAQTESLIPPLQISLRQAGNQLCVLLGIPAEDLEKVIGPGAIPRVAPEVAVGIPAELLRRRPDVRRDERLLAAQSARIGIATTNLYPQISILGVIGVEASLLPDLFTEQSHIGNIGPSLRWDILNYGRNLNRIREQDAFFQELVARYQNTVLVANQEVENGLVAFLQYQVQVRSQGRAVDAASKSVELVMEQLRQGKVDFNRVFVMQRDLVTQQDLLAQAQGNVVQGLIAIYRALGGGWQIRLTDGDGGLGVCNEPPPAPDATPIPQPEGLPPPRKIDMPAAPEKKLPVSTGRLEPTSLFVAQAVKGRRK